MRILNNLFKIAAVAGYSLATAECVFSPRNRIDTPYRRRLTPYKQGNLTLLHFEKKIVRNVRFPEFLSKFKAKRVDAFECYPHVPYFYSHIYYQVLFYASNF